jgi:hypothetical protein
MACKEKSTTGARRAGRYRAAAGAGAVCEVAAAGAAGRAAEYRFPVLPSIKGGVDFYPLPSKGALWASYIFP